MFDGLVTRVPIYTSELDLYGYDLRFCSANSLQDQVRDDDSTLGNLLIRASENVSLDKITGHNPSFVKMPGELLNNDMILVWPKDQIVLNITEELVQEQQQCSNVRQLASQGYRFSLESQSISSYFNNISECASFWSLDAGSVDEEVAVELTDLKKNGVSLLAKNVETLAQFNLVKKLGFNFFQGPYFEKPKLVSNLQIPANRIAALNLIARLQDPDIPISEVEKLVGQDVTLSYKLLRLINSAFFGLPKRVDSIQRAVIFFGFQRIKNWASVLIINSTDYKPKELLVTSLVRARTCELLAKEIKQKNLESFYIAGLFSVLDAIMDIPMEKILERLNLVPEIDQALLEKSGIIGEILQSTLDLEQGQYHQSGNLPIETGIAFNAYLDAIAWASALTQQTTESES